ncbi:MAG: flagellar hook-basal body complex protein FliE [Clostridium sp.]|uniref:flagellar hook-basal body complex protein FliE n=1 Tax=Clostridium sp. DSM 8431 TaxID=1761781 RepID=UPI0008E9B749|nr:flagellar hook-basal body complex protein FliE [Clostridium sp. DSM 8431]MCR4944381.1 flagellar hook-basal body complex protein FliE [Clostridium sp.]SFU30788.1 flagellar hook-basal body complex protein FliE [Clostridium sp. DSM 8431]
MRVNNYVPSEKIFEVDGASNNGTKSNGIKSFSETLTKALDEVNDTQIKADEATNAFVSGQDMEISDVMLAAEEGKLTLQFAVQVRNKLVDAYKELSNIQI